MKNSCYPILSDDEAVYYARKNGLLRETAHPYRLIDLFSGAGGMTLGFTDVFGQVFVPVWANDNNRLAVDTYNENFGDHCICSDICEIVEKNIATIPRADVVIGGPPCQGFSLLNKNRKYDPRKQLWRPFLDVVAHCGAEIFVMENVPQILNSHEHEQILETAETIGFKTASAKLCAADYGVPQIRWRAFIIGCKFTDPRSFFPPGKTHQKKVSIPVRDMFDDDGIKSIGSVNAWKSVRDAIRDLPPPVGTALRSENPPMDLHFGRMPTAMSLARYKTIPDEGMNRFDLQKAAPEITPACWIRKTKGGTDLFGRLWWDRPAFTIRTEFFKPEKGRYLHPEQHRPITHREAARLQSFPDSFRFKGTKIEIAKQIGNAVPPLMAARIADSVLSMFALKVNAYDGQVSTRREKPDHVPHQRLEHNY